MARYSAPGIFPMFPKKTSGKYVLYTSKRMHLITFLLLTVYSVCFAMTIVKKSNNVVGGKFYKQRNKVSNFGLTLEFMFGIVILYTIYFVSFPYTKYVKVVLTDINKVDKLLKRISYGVRYESTVWYQMFVIISGLLLFVIIASMQIQNIKIENFPPISLPMWILFLYPALVLFVMNSQFGITVSLIYQRFRMISNRLTKIKAELTVENTRIMNEITILSKIHEILCRAANRTNLNYNIQMLPTMTHQFFISLYSVFYYYWMHASKPFSASCWLAWGFLKVCEILHVAISCHLASQEAEIVGPNIHKVLIKTRNQEIEERLLTFSHQVKRSNFKFTLCGLFDINASLLFNMIGSSTTFIVIMIQFQETLTPTVCASNRTNLLIQ